MIALAPVDLTGVGVGQGGSVPLASLGLTSDPSLYNKPPTLYFHNDSACALQISFKIGTMSFNLPAGGWMPVQITPGESTILYTCTALMSGPAISKLFINYFGPGEPVPAITLGNSPVGGTTSVAGGIATAVQNDGNAAGTSVVEATQNGSPQSTVIINNDGTVTIGQYVGGIWTAILQILPGATPHVILGGIGESITIEDNIFLDGLTTFGSGGATTIDGSGRYNSSQSFTLTNSGANMEPPPDSINGGTSGTATAWMDLTGTIKRCLIFLNNFRTAAAAQNLTLPTAFTSHALVRAGVAGTSATPTGMSFLKGGVAQSMRIYATPSANGDSGVGPNTTLYGGSWAEINSGSGFDTVQFLANWGAAFTGLIEIVGL